MIRTKYLYYYLTINKKNHLWDNLPTLDNLKKNYIRYLLKWTDYDIYETAHILNVSLAVLHKKLDEYNFRQ